MALAGALTDAVTVSVQPAAYCEAGRTCGFRKWTGAWWRHRRRVRKALARGHGDLADQLGKLPPAARVLRALAVHDILELGVSGHGWRQDRGDPGGATGERLMPADAATQGSMRLKAAV
jgi:hypothetical protein